MHGELTLNCSRVSWVSNAALCSRDRLEKQAILCLQNHSNIHRAIGLRILELVLVKFHIIAGRQIIRIDFQLVYRMLCYYSIAPNMVMSDV